MAHARRLAPLLLQTAQRATIGDLDMYTQHMSPDALDGHRGPCLLLHNTPALMSVVPYARLAVGAKERASCLARFLESLDILVAVAGTVFRQS